MKYTSILNKLKGWYTRMGVSWLAKRFGFYYGVEDMQQEIELIKLEEGSDSYFLKKNRIKDLLRRKHRQDRLISWGEEVNAAGGVDPERIAILNQFIRNLSYREKAILKRLLNGETITEITISLQSRTDSQRLIKGIREKATYFCFDPEFKLLESRGGKR